VYSTVIISLTVGEASFIGRFLSALSLIACCLLSRAKQGALERGVEPTRDDGYLLVTKLSESCRGLVVFEDAVPGIVLIKHNADRSIERGR
jgi:hypothetical protein